MFRHSELVIQVSIRRFLFLFCFCFGLAATSSHAADLLGVRFGPDQGKTRIVFDTAGAPNYSIMGDGLGEGRLIVDFEGLSVPPKAQTAQRGKGHIASYQFIAQPDGGYRAVMAFKSTARIDKQFLIEPSPGVAKHRLVIDLVSSDKPAFIASLPQRYPDLGAVIEQATAAKAPRKPDVEREVNALPVFPDPPAKRVIVVDPGHGGADPGAQGQSGTFEKHVNLKAAFALKEILEKKRRFKVVLTRTTDKKIPLDKREEMARLVNADLFISLHADALASKQVRGASVYTLSDKGSARSARLAKEEGNYRVYNLDVAEYGEEVGDILFDLAQGTTNKASSRFAELLISELSGKVPLLNKTHRTGDLRVLLSPDVPAVLFEMAFISNAKDEANLNSLVWRQQTMNAVASAIDAYFDETDARRFAQNKATTGN